MNLAPRRMELHTIPISVTGDPSSTSDTITKGTPHGYTRALPTKLYTDYVGVTSDKVGGEECKCPGTMITM